MCDGLALLKQHSLGRSGCPAGVDDQKIIVGQRIHVGFAVRLRGEPGLEWRRGEVAGIEADDRFEIGAIADFAEFLGEFGLDDPNAWAAGLESLKLIGTWTKAPLAAAAVHSTASALLLPR